MKYVSYGLVGLYIVMVFVSYFMQPVFTRPILLMIVLILFFVNIVMCALEDVNPKDIMISTGVFALFNIGLYMLLVVGGLL